MRQIVIVSVDSEDWDILPFLPIEREPLTVTVGVPVDVGRVWWWIQRGFVLNLLFHVDAATSVTSTTTYARSIFLERMMPPGEGSEWGLGFPGPEIEEAFPDGVSGPLGVYNAFRYEATPVSVGADDIFDSTTFEASLELFSGGYDEAVEGMLVTMKLRVGITYDDGSEGVIYIQSIPTDVPDLLAGKFKIEGTGTIEGYSFGLQAGDTASTTASPYFTDMVEVELVPALYFEYRNREGEDPIYDGSTGTQLRDPFTFEE